MAHRFASCVQSLPVSDQDVGRSVVQEASAPDSIEALGRRIGASESQIAELKSRTSRALTALVLLALSLFALAADRAAAWLVGKVQENHGEENRSSRAP